MTPVCDKIKKNLAFITRLRKVIPEKYIFGRNCFSRKFGKFSGVTIFFAYLAGSQKVIPENMFFFEILHTFVWGGIHQSILRRRKEYIIEGENIQNTADQSISIQSETLYPKINGPIARKGLFMKNIGIVEQKNAIAALLMFMLQAVEHNTFIVDETIVDVPIVDELIVDGPDVEVLAVEVSAVEIPADEVTAIGEPVLA